jgi:protein TonB
MAFSLLAHGVLALGIGFSIEDAAPVVPTLDVILTRTHSQTPPEKADFLAQASQEGGGDAELPDRPREPTPAPVPRPEPGVAPAPIEAGAPKPQPQTRQAVLTTQSQSEQLADKRPTRQTDPLPLPNSRQLIERSLEMARLAAEVERQRAAYAKRPKKKFISASTKEYEFASYMRAWVARVERIGNLNYPDEARRRNLQGQLVMTVAVRRDGSVANITVVQPSGYNILDEAAIRTVRLSEPFGPLPETKEGVDELHITRTWQFLPGNVMRNQ